MYTKDNIEGLKFYVKGDREETKYTIQEPKDGGVGIVWETPEEDSVGYNIETVLDHLNGGQWVPFPQQTIKGMKKQFKNCLIVTGTNSLLQAFAMELEKIGYDPYHTITEGDGDNFLITYNDEDSSCGGVNKMSMRDAGNILTYGNSKNKHLIELAKDWDKGLELAKEETSFLDKLKVGDYVLIKSDNLKSSEGSIYAGKIVQVNAILSTSFKEPDYIRTKQDLGGIYFSEIERLLDELEYLKQQKQTTSINGYSVEFKDNRIHFGCQSFSKEELKTYLKLLERPIAPSIMIGETKITTTMLRNLLEMFK